MGKKINKIQFVFPPSTVDGVGIEGCYVPNGILSIANYIKERFNGEGENSRKIEVEIIDGTVEDLDSILENIGGDGTLVATSDLAGNYEESKIIKKEAKEKGALTISGNHHSNFLFDLAMTDPGVIDPNLDFILPGRRAEVEFGNLIEIINGNGNFNEIHSYVPSLAYRNGNSFILDKDKKEEKEKERLPRLKDLTKPDLSLIKDFNQYFINYNTIFGNKQDQKLMALRSNIKNKTLKVNLEERIENNELNALPLLTNENFVRQININKIIGCEQGKKDPCVYCCLKDYDFMMVTARDYVQNIKSLVEDGFNYIFETCNSLTSFVPYIDKIINELNNEEYNAIRNNFKMQIYGSASEINDSVIQKLKKINVDRIIFGFDSGDNETLEKGIGKFGKNTAEHNLEVAKKLNDAGIEIYACYVPGSEIETPETLEKSYNQILDLLKLENTKVIEWTSLAPMPGSKAWEMIKNDYWQEHGKSDSINVKKLAKSWVDNKVKGDISDPNNPWYGKDPWDEINKYANKIKDKIDEINKKENRNIIFGGYY